jgi:hypothetical protein
MTIGSLSCRDQRGTKCPVGEDCAFGEPLATAVLAGVTERVGVLQMVLTEIVPLPCFSTED